MPLGTCEVPVNPSEEHPPNKAPALSIPSEAFSLSAHHNYRAFSIYVKVSPTQQLPVGQANSKKNQGQKTLAEKKYFLINSRDFVRTHDFTFIDLFHSLATVYLKTRVA